MKRRIISIVVIVLVLCSIMLFYACKHLLSEVLYNELGNRNWYIELNEDYKIQQISGKDIVLIRQHANGPTEVVISHCIVAYCSDRNFVGFTCDADSNNLCYYFLDLQQTVLYGPFNDINEYYIFCNHNSFPVLNTWKKTFPKPNEATYW